MSEEEVFLKQIKENPYDILTRLVYADWLEEQGDPRAKDIRSKTIFDSSNIRVGIFTREGTHVVRLSSSDYKNPHRFSDEEVKRLIEGLNELSKLHPEISLDFSSVRIENRQLANLAQQLHALNPVARIKSLELSGNPIYADSLLTILSSPLFDALDYLDVSNTPVNYQELCSARSSSIPAFQNLSRLAIGIRSVPNRIADHPSVFPHLKSLSIRGATLTKEGAEAVARNYPELRSLTFYDCDMGEEALPSLIACRDTVGSAFNKTGLAQLEKFSWWGNENRNKSCNTSYASDLSEFASYLGQGFFPNLQQLEFWGCGLGDAGVEKLCGINAPSSSAGLTNLVSLVLRQENLSGHAFETLASDSSRIKALQALDLSENQMGPAMLHSLAGSETLGKLEHLTIKGLRHSNGQFRRNNRSSYEEWQAAFSALAAQKQDSPFSLLTYDDIPTPVNLPEESSITFESHAFLREMVAREARVRGGRY